MIPSWKSVRVVSLVVALVLAAVFVTAQQRRQVPRPIPMYEQYAEGLLARTIYVSEGGPQRVEIWDLLVGPGRRTAPFRLPGGAVLETRSGQGNVTVSGKQYRVTTGTPFTADEGSEIVLVNGNSDIGLYVRAIVITAR